MYSRYETASASPILLIIYIAIIIFYIASLWRLFTKAGQEGWFAIVPIVNTVTYLSIGGVPCFYLLLLVIPFVNIFVLLYIHYKVAEAFGQGVGFALGLWLLPFIFVPILAFGDYEYQGDTNSNDDWEKPKNKRKNDDNDSFEWR
jgi:hypothetical protein